MSTLDDLRSTLGEDLRPALGDRAIAIELLRAALQPNEIMELRRRYFPRWRPHREHSASESLRAFRKVMVEDEFEKLVVLAIAPRDFDVKVEVAGEVEITPMREAALQGS